MLLPVYCRWFRNAPDPFRRRWPLTLLFCATASISAFAGQSGPPPGTFTLSDNVNLVVLDVSVSDAKDRIVSGLKKDNFLAFEDGSPRPIAVFDASDAPVTVGLVVDNSGSMAAKRREVVLAGLAFAKASNSEDEFFVVNFNDSVLPGVPGNLAFTDQLELIRSALYFGQPKGRTALYDAISYGLQHLELGHRRRRTLIVVSDGGDNASAIDWPHLRKQIEASRATIFTVGVFDADDRDRNPGVLRNIAGLTGGEFFRPSKLADVLPIFKKISGEIRSRYTVGYVPDQMHDHRTRRTAKILVRDDKGRKLRARNRSTYAISDGGR